MENKKKISSKHIPLDRVANLRDLGGIETSTGKTIKNGRILRSSDLHELSENDKRVLKSLNISDIVDLRTESEIRNFPDKLLAGWTLHKMPVFDFDMEEGPEKSGFEEKPITREGIEEMVSILYPRMLFNPVGIQTWKDLFSLLLSQPQGVVFHCTEGKDRTGIAAILILSALGADEDTIKKDYLLTNSYLDRINAQHARRGLLREDDPIFKGVSKRFFQALQKAAEPYGGFKGYLESVVGLNPEDFARLQEIYLTDNGKTTLTNKRNTDEERLLS